MGLLPSFTYVTGLSLAGYKSRKPGKREQNWGAKKV